ncbi:uncharacterized protein LOC112876854 isoform X2 [Panicum hallii]|uniref:uncharacterized protein LOC112876854 isoform X2 n=1 Tax=Panicum hallii TaxID=206008 RepID=UPI000DF4D0A9|nr:uncharacterized protein LOC112876854 isoform X2 [Panicum hallii]
MPQLAFTLLSHGMPLGTPSPIAGLASARAPALPWRAPQLRRELRPRPGTPPKFGSSSGLASPRCELRPPLQLSPGAWDAAAAGRRTWRLSGSLCFLHGLASARRELRPPLQLSPGAWNPTTRPRRRGELSGSLCFLHDRVLRLCGRLRPGSRAVPCRHDSEKRRVELKAKLAMTLSSCTVQSLFS